MRPPICLQAFRCAAVRHMLRDDPRYAMTLRNKEWREVMWSVPGWDFQQELRKLRGLRVRDTILLRDHEI